MPKFKPGIVIRGDDGTTQNNLFVIVSEIRTLTREELDEGTARTNDFPLNFTFEELVDFQLADNLKRPEKAIVPFTIDDAIIRAREVVNNLRNAGVQADIIMPNDVAMNADVMRLAQWIRNGKVVGIIGTTGIGKTAKVRQACTLVGFSNKPEDGDVLYISVPTLPQEDLVGVPVPDTDNTQYFHYRTLRRLDTCKVMILDEFNRGSEKVLNALMQLIAERRINDQFFPNLQSLVLMWNPNEDSDYSGTIEFDKAVIARVDHYLEMEADPNAEVIAEETGCDIEVAETAVKWWNSLKDSMKNEIDPRRLAKICRAWHDGEDIATTLLRSGPHKVSVSLDILAQQLRNLNILTMDYLLANHSKDLPARMTADTAEAAGLRNRFMELVWQMKRDGLYKELYQVRHLFDCVHKDQVPTKGSSHKSLHAFVIKAVKKHGTAAELEEFTNYLTKRENDIDKIADELSAGVEAMIRANAKAQTASI